MAGRDNEQKVVSVFCLDKDVYIFIFVVALTWIKLVLWCQFSCFFRVVLCVFVVFCEAYFAFLLLCLCSGLLPPY